MMELWAFVLLGAGLVFILLEVFFPSFGILGTLAAGALIAGGVCAWNAESGVFTTYLMVAFVLGPVVTAFALKMFPRSWFGRKYTLPGSTFAASESAAGGGGADFIDLLHGNGTAITPLRPAGKAQINDRRVDVVTRGEAVDAGAKIRVLLIEGNRIVVAEERA
jgi:membrane-bound serine protease (ClpP class)